ncbi:MAG: histidine phosphatase family protein [Planctomicrobium sp.]|jgi:phosphohistidine phosphatase|nr:histidine phosphatase family protein [Planctomicrobium sp.]
MKTLLLMRHAKSSWANAGMQDHDRPLNKRGELDAPEMGHWLKSQELIPDRIICSSAKRTCQTAEAIAAIINCQFEIIDQLYLANLRTWNQVLSKYTNGETILAIGHNPGIEQFVEAATGNYERMPTAAIAWFNCDSITEDYNLKNMQLQTTWRPKEIKSTQD